LIAESKLTGGNTMDELMNDPIRATINDNDQKALNDFDSN
jgi:hypothetical protein